MTLLVISPDYASHYTPLSVLASAARDAGHRVVVATGDQMRPRVEADGLEWRCLRLGPTSNGGIAGLDPGLQRFLDATRSGPVATLRRQALDREHDLLWEPEAVARAIARTCDDLDPDLVLVDHVSFGSTLGVHATGRPFVTLVPGHPSQLPVGTERYGVPAAWPRRLTPSDGDQQELARLADRVARVFTDRWNEALAVVAPDRPPVPDAFRVHGQRVLYHAVAEHQDPRREADLPVDHRFLGPLASPSPIGSHDGPWGPAESERRPRGYVALGTFLSHRGDVLARVAEALRHVGVRAAIATGATDPHRLGAVPDDWLVAPVLPQVALLGGADLAVHHGGNNSVQESLAAGVRQLVLPFSTDQFANAADLEREGIATALAPNDATPAELAVAVEAALATPRPAPVAPLTPADLAAALLDPAVEERR